MTLEKFSKLNFSIFILLLPFTALGYFYNIFHSWCQNASLYPLILGTIILIINIFMTGKIKLNKYINLFLFFNFLSLIGCLIMSLYINLFLTINVGTYEEILKRSLLKFFTVSIIFFSFYYPYHFIILKTEKNLNYVIKLIYISFMIVMTYGYFQIFSLLKSDSIFFQVYMTIQRYINFAWIGLNEKYNYLPQIFLYGGRVILTNQEPSISAYLLQVLLYPFLFASFIANYSIFKIKFLCFKPEYLLFIISIPILFLTFSTAAYFVFFIQILIVFLLYVNHNKITFSFLFKPKKMFLILLLLLTISIFIYQIMPQKYLIIAKMSIDKLFMKGSGSESAQTRYGFILAGLIEFLHYPILGVGLSNSKYLFANFIPEWAYNSEVISYIQTGKALGPKSLWTLLLGETGIVGFAVFIYFLFSLSKSFFIIKLQNNEEYFIKYSYIIFLFTFLMHGFNSAALFFIFQWAILGIFVAMIELIKNRNNYDTLS